MLEWEFSLDASTDPYLNLPATNRPPAGMKSNTYVAKIYAKDGKVLPTSVNPKGYDRQLVFKDLGTLIVNSSADASSDPTIIPYTKFRPMLFNTLFDLEIINKKIKALLLSLDLHNKKRKIKLK